MRCDLIKQLMRLLLNQMMKASGGELNMNRRDQYILMRERLALAKCLMKGYVFLEASSQASFTSDRILVCDCLSLC
jgi:hypothetical protein